jgi:hypothetical protein
VTPFFSPDGQWVGFYSRGLLKKVSLVGGGVVTISSEAAGYGGFGAAWGEDGNIISSSGIGASYLIRLPSAGGKPQPLGELYREQGEGLEGLPQILPGGKRLLYTAPPWQGRPITPSPS